MDKPCIVCHENCPVSPKAIFTRDHFSTIHHGIFKIKSVENNLIEIEKDSLEPGKFATGDYYCLFNDGRRIKISANTEKTITINSKESDTIPVDAGIELQVRLQRPYVDIEKCIGCGICEHECPVSGKRAVRVSAEGETRSSNRSLSLKG